LLWDLATSCQLAQVFSCTSNPRVVASAVVGLDLSSDISLIFFAQAPVPVAIGGPGLPEGVVFREDLPEAGLANITATYINLLGYASPAHMVPSLIA
jgi:hypothetical protein